MCLWLICMICWYVYASLLACCPPLVCAALNQSLVQPALSGLTGHIHGQRDENRIILESQTCWLEAALIKPSSQCPEN